MVGGVSMITRFGFCHHYTDSDQQKTELRRKRSHATESEVTTHLVTRRRALIAMNRQSRVSATNPPINIPKLESDLGNMKLYTFMARSPSRKVFDILRPSSHRKASPEKSLFCDTKPKPKGDT